MTFRPDESALDELLLSPKGPVGLHISRLGRAALAKATETCPGRSGALRTSLEAIDGANSAGPFVSVGSRLPYMKYIRFGTQPHVIVPRAAKALRFEVGGGRVVFARRVNHPGTKANDFLAEAVRKVTA